MGDDSEWLKLPTEEKVVHKAWKARLAGYEEALKLFSTLDEKDGQFVNYLDLLKKFVIDNNAIAQEKALDAVLAFVETAQVAKRNAGEIVGLVINKCLNATRAKTKDRAVDIILMYVEIDKPDVVAEELIKGLDNKQPKIVQGCVQCLRMALDGVVGSSPRHVRLDGKVSQKNPSLLLPESGKPSLVSAVIAQTTFGPKVVQLKPIIKVISKLLEDRDKGVRDEGKLLVVEIYKWIGAGLKPQLANLKPVQIQELEAEFEKLPTCKPVQTRFMRSQQDLKAKAEAQSAATSANGSGEPGDDGASSAAAAAADIDPYDLLDPVEILSKLPKEFYEQVEAKKWQDRKDVLEACQKLTDNPKLDPSSDYGELVRVLCKVVAKDTNVMLVAIAAKCLFGLATGLRKKFSPYAVTCIKVFLEKFKEKKANVVAAVREAIDAAYVTTNLEAICEDIIASLNDKNPSVKSETATFLARCCFARCTPATLPKKLLKPLCETLLKTINDMAAEVREAAFQALGTAMKVISEKAIAPFLADVDSIKMAKIKECCDKAELVFMKGKSASAATAAPASVAAPAPAPAKAAAGTAKSQPSAAAAAPKKADGAKAVAGAAKAGGAAKAAGGKGPGKGGAAAEAALPVESLLAPEVADEKAKALLTEEVVNGLANANWKDRLASAETALQKIKGTPREELPTQAIVYVIGSKKPGLKDTNFQVLKMRLEIVAYLAQNFKFTKTSAEYVLADLVDKVGDAKNGDGAKEALTAIAEATDFAFVSQEVLGVAIDQQKNPKNQAEALTWLANGIKEFGFKVNVKPMVSFLKKALQATNPAVRTAAVSGVLPIMYMHMGSPLRMLFEDEKPALVQQIDAEFEKVKGERPPAPTRGVKASSRGDVNGGTGGDDGDDGDGGASAVVDLMPRTDISGKITEGLLAKLGDKNWKIRKEGLDEVVAILSEAKFITADIGSLPEALKARLGDSNKILVTTALSICQTLAIASGPSVRKHIPVLAGAVIANMSDSKPQLRQTVVDTLDAWVKETKLVPFVEDNVLSEAIKQENPNLRAALLTWLALKLPLEKKLPAEALRECLPPLFACLGDRNPEVRKSAQDCLLPFMTHTGFDAMLRVANKMDRGSKDLVMPLIEKAKEAWQQQKQQQQKLQPQPPPAAVAPAAATAKPSKPQQTVKPPSPATVANDYDDAQDDDDSAKPTGKAAESAPKGAAAAAAAAKGKPAAAGGAAAAGGKAKPGSAAPAAGRKKGEEEDTSPLMAVNYTKAQRIKDEKALKVLKWNFPAPRQEFVDQLRDQMEKNFSSSAIELLFHSDFQRHTKVIALLQSAAETMKDATVDNLDVILKWMTLRFFDTNPSMLNKALEYLQVLFRVLGDSSYQLLDSEATSFVPYLLLKVGDSKDNVRKDVRAILKQLCKVYPASKMFPFILVAVDSKNTKQRMECLEELGWLIEMFGINVCQPTPAQALKEVAKNISNGDNKVRLAALNTIVVAHSLIGETVFKFVGQLNEKDMSMLEERIKRSVKKPPPAVQASGPAAPAQQSAAAADRDKSPEKERPMTAPEPAQSRLQAARSVDNVPAATAVAAASTVAAGGLLRRPTTAGSLASVATVKPEFTLGVDAAALPRPPEPRLVDHSELEALMREPELVPHPRLRHAVSQQQLASSGAGSPAGMAARLLGVGGGSGTITSDVSVAVDLVISQVASSDPATAVAALAQIDTTLKSATKGELFSGHADQLLSLATLQLKKAFNKHLVDSVVSRELVIRLFRCLGATIISLCEHTQGALAREATCDTLKDLVGTLVGVVLDSRLEALGDEGVLIVRSINFVIVRVLEFADGTNVMSALVRLLHDCVGNSACSPKYIELVMKCLWKMTRRINSVVAASLRLEVLFMDFNTFLTAYPVNSWKDKSCGDTPLRTIKTLIHTLVKVLGSQKISSSMSSLESSGALAATSELLTFLRRVVRHGGNNHMPDDDSGGGADVHQAAASRADSQALKSSEQLHQPPLGSVNGVKSVASNGAEKKGTRKLPKDVHDTLAEIFKKIGSKENTKEGLNDLYDFRLKHPDADLEPFIRKSSQFFQTYIERGLKNIELERQGKQAKHAHDATLNVTVAPKAAGKTSADGTADPETAAYRERLQKLLARTGGSAAAGAASLTAAPMRSTSGLSVDSLQDYKTPLSSLSAADPLPASLHMASGGGAAKREVPTARPPPDVSDLKARLERIKAGKAT